MEQPASKGCPTMISSQRQDAGGEWVLELSPFKVSQIEGPSTIRWKMLRVKAANAKSSARCSESEELSNLAEHAAQLSKEQFDSLLAVGPQACVGNAVRTLSVALAGSLCRLECREDVWLQDTDWCSHLTLLEELRLHPCREYAPVYRAVARLPQLRKMVCTPATDEGWRDLCNLTQLKELRVTCRPKESCEHLADLCKLSGLTHLQIFLPSRGLCVSDLLEHMPHLESLSVQSRGGGCGTGELLGNFKHTKLRRVSLCSSWSAKSYLSISRWCPNLEEITVNGRVDWDNSGPLGGGGEGGREGRPPPGDSGTGPPRDEAATRGDVQRDDGDESPAWEVKMEEGQEVRGKVECVKAWGAFVELPKGKRGFIHRCSIVNSSQEEVADARAVLSVGDSIKVEVTWINEHQDIALRMTTEEVDRLQLLMKKAADGMSAQLVMNLRDRIKGGVRVMDCKKALVECNGDLGKAAQYLHEKGLVPAKRKADGVAAEKRAGGVDAEGMVD